MSKQSFEVFEQMGLSEGYHVPIANTNNVQLEEELQRLILSKARAAADLESLYTRCIGLEKHLKYVKNEQLNNQNLLVTHNTHLDNERHMYTTIKMEREKYHSDVKKMMGEMLKLETAKESKHSNLKHLMTRLDKLKISVKWDEKTIENLEEKVLKKTDDNELLKKFSKEDQKRAHELEIKRRRLREEELARKQLVVRIANEIECLQLSLGRNVQMYKQMHDERNTMVRQWQESVKQLQQRNKDTVTINNEMEAIRSQLHKNLQTLEEQRQFAENEQANNYELEMKIANEKAETGRIRLKLDKYIALSQDRNVEREALQRELRLSAVALNNQRFEMKRLTTEITKMNEAHAFAVSKIAYLNDQLAFVMESSISAEDRIRRLEEVIKSEEINHKCVLSDIQRMQDTFYRSQQLLLEQKDTSKLKEMAHRLTETAIAALQKQIAQTEQEFKQSTETIYKLTFRMNMLESRLSRMTNDRNDDESEIFQLRLKELTTIMVGVSETGTLLQAQVKRLEDDMRRLTISISNDNDVQQITKDQLQDRMLKVDGGIMRLGQKRARNNKLKVDQNVLLVRVKGAEKALKKEGGVVFGMQRQKMELEAVVRERKEEINIQQELLHTTRRALEDDVGRMQADYRNRQIRIEQLKGRTECILQSLGKSEDGEALSITYFRVRNAQEKYGLQQEGDRLDKLIRRTEREIVAMENTLRVMNSTNELYRNTLSLLEDDADEIAVGERLQEQLAELSQQLRVKNSELLERSRMVRITRSALEDVRIQFQNLSETKLEKMEAYKEVIFDEKDRKMMLSRAEAAAKITDCSCGDEFKDMTIRQLREVNRSALQQLYEVTIRFIQTSPVINRYLSERNISLPSSSLGSRSSSRRSIQSSRSLKTVKSDTSSNSAISAITLTLNVPCLP